MLTQILGRLTPQPFLHWFTPPELSRPDLQRRARELWMVSWPFFAVVAVVLGIAVLVEPQTLARRATTIAAVGTLITLLHSVSRAGRPTLASWMLVVGLSALVTQRAWITGGIHAPVAVFYVLFVVMAGVLLGARGGFVTAAVCFLSAFVLTIGTAAGWLASRPDAGSALGGFVFAALAIGLALVLHALLTLRPRERRAPDGMQMLVHDLRSPIQALLLHLELLRADMRGESVTDVECAIDHAMTLRRLTTNILDVGRLEAARMPVTRSITDLSALAHAAVKAIHILQPARDITIEARGDWMCNCDRELTRRIVENLLSNAMKHTATEGRVRVEISGSRDRVCIAVGDEGPGIPPDRRAEIFAPYSAEGLRSATGADSSGLGLTFCRLAAEAQGGSIRVENGTPRGTVFVLDLPR